MKITWHKKTWQHLYGGTRHGWVTWIDGADQLTYDFPEQDFRGNYLSIVRIGSKHFRCPANWEVA